MNQYKVKFVIISDPRSILKRHQLGFACLEKEFACDKCDECGKGFTETERSNIIRIYTLGRSQGSGQERKNTKLYQLSKRVNIIGQERIQVFHL